jgi:hypothetical protein
MSAGGLVGMVVNFIIFSVICSAIGKGVDIIITVANMSPGISMDALNTISNLHLIYVAGPFLYALALGYNYIVVSNSEANQEV